MPQCGLSGDSQPVQLSFNGGQLHAEDGPGADATIAQPAYLAIPAEFERADGPLRAGQLCQVLDVGRHRELHAATHSDT
ncbi:hypothetical protein ABH926_006270 [Catenulispora sp. GP43]